MDQNECVDVDIDDVCVVMMRCKCKLNFSVAMFLCMPMICKSEGMKRNFL